ncbi:MAG: zinc ribbon domain-containing protein [Rectinemataceae bacterium]|jgi:hypothetical protein
MIDFSVYGEQTPHIEGYKCENCGTIYYPAPMICKKCDAKRDPVTGKGWETFDLDGKCTLLTWTRVWNLPEGFNKKFLMFGMVEFPNGLRASGRIEMEGDPAMGMKLEARVIEADERPGKPVKVFVFS